MSASAITVEKTTAEIAKAFPGVELVEKKAYHRVALGKVTLGYAYIRGTRPAIEVVNGDGKYTYFGVKTAADLRSAIAAMRKVEKAAAKKAAAAAKKAS